MSGTVPHTTGSVEPAVTVPTDGLERVPLPKGVALGGVTYATAVLRALTFADIMEANEAAEKVVLTKDGAALVSSPALIGRETLRRQIARLEGPVGQKHDGPLSVAELGLFHPLDVEAIHAGLDRMDKVDALKIAGGLEERGRTHAGAPAS
jgi:phage FluMu protein gp41